MYSHKSFWVVITLLFGLVWLKGTTTLDPDFGSHYKTGETIIYSGIPKADPFSYTMPSFLPISHAWILDVLLFWGQNKIGFVGLAFICTLIVIATLVVSIPRELRKFSIFPLMVSLPVILSRAGVRTQIIDWLFLVVLIRLKNREYLLPFLFLIWANLHGGFVIGLVIFSIHIFCEFIQNKKIHFFLLSIFYFLLSVLITFITPYGWKMWFEVWATISDPYLKKYIVEWLPFWNTVEFGFLLLSTFIFTLGFIYREKIGLFDKFLYLFLFLTSLSSLRHTSLFILVAIPLGSLLMKNFYESAQTIPFGKDRFRQLQKIFLIIALVFSTWEVRNLDVNPKYPQGAINFLTNNLPKGNLFSEYGWGGYLIWKLPEKKVFIDGRMPSWRYDIWPFKSTAPKNESAWVFKDYMKIAYGGDYRKLFDKYNIDTVLLPKENLYQNILKNKDKSFFKLITNLEKEGWKEIYSDNVAVILQKSYN
jgi:hypothetical protein